MDRINCFFKPFLWDPEGALTEEFYTELALYDKGLMRLGMLQRLKGWGASPHVLKHTYLTFIPPILENGYHFSQLASDLILSTLQKMQNKALKTILTSQVL